MKETKMIIGQESKMYDTTIVKAPLITLDTSLTPIYARNEILLAYAHHTGTYLGEAPVRMQGFIERRKTLQEFEHTVRSTPQFHNFAYQYVLCPFPFRKVKYGSAWQLTEKFTEVNMIMNLARLHSVPVKIAETLFSGRGLSINCSEINNGLGFDYPFVAEVVSRFTKFSLTKFSSGDEEDIPVALNRGHFVQMKHALSEEIRAKLISNTPSDNFP